MGPVAPPLPRLGPTETPVPQAGRNEPPGAVGGAADAAGDAADAAGDAAAGAADDAGPITVNTEEASGVTGSSRTKPPVTTTGATVGCDSI